MGIRQAGLKIKYPILPSNIETCDIKYKGQQLRRYTGEDLNGIRWTDFQSKVGTDLNLNDKFVFRFLFTDGKQYNGTTQAINNSVQKKENLLSNMDNEKILSAFRTLEQKLNNAAKESGGIPYQILLDSQKAGYEAQINYLKQQIDDKNISIQEYKNQITKLENDIDSYLDELEELRGKSGYGQLVEIAQKFLVTKLGSPKVTTLKESDPSDIPDEILQILGAVDYVKLKQDPVSYQKIVDTLKQYIQFLPLKGQ